ncbi:unnamed protein product [Hymenolepis diminuta]|uniref:Fucosyltransferase n=1 Tax=Hymenolepis diminuta TaxID=6216 RepID=A0A0R3SMI8_HYMDI|nr:unnamed protein product [Hymenolepis diminuta]
MIFLHIQKVDIFGRQGRPIPPSPDPFQWISENYKFYLAFENSNCWYYITEKVTSNSLRYGLVPIVLGARKEDYVNTLPPHSYINVDDFKSFQDLANYLLYLDKNHTAYAEYFAWKEYGYIYVNKRLDCQTCGFVHHLNARKLKLNNISWQYFMNPSRLCFDRPLLPLYSNHS